MIPIMAAANQNGRKRRRKGRSLSIWFSILILTSILFPVGFLLIGVSGGGFVSGMWILILIGGIMFMVAGTMITAISTDQSDLKDPDEIDELCSRESRSGDSYYKNKGTRNNYQTSEPRGTYSWDIKSNKSPNLFCTNCGVQLDHGDRFCFACGESTNNT
jgi:flagellar basal body-associated protein FliL